MRVGAGAFQSTIDNSLNLLNRPAADAAAPVEVDKDDEEGVEVEENDYEDDEKDEGEEHEEDDEDFNDDDEDVEEDEVDVLFGSALGCFGVLWGFFGDPLGTFWGRLGGLWGSLGLPWRSLGAPWGALGASVGCRFASWSLLGRFLGPFRHHVGSILGSISKRKSAFVFGSLLEPFCEAFFLNFGEVFGSKVYL